MPTRTSSHIIDELLIAVSGPASDPRQRHVFLQALHGLVRLAKTEQMLEIKMHVEKATGAMACSSSRRHTRAILRKMGVKCDAGQGHFKFDREDSGQ